MKRRPVAKPSSQKPGSRLIGFFYQIAFFLYICLWSFICFGVRLLRMLLGKVAIAVLSLARRPRRAIHQQQKEINNKHKDQV